LNLFDARTAFFITGLLYFLMPLVVWQALREQKSDAVKLWCAGGELFGAGLLLISLRGQIPDWVSFELASLFMHLGNTQRIQALRKELGTPMSAPVFAATAAVFWLGYVIARTLVPDGPYHFVWSLLAVGVQCIWISLLAQRIRRNEHIQSAKWLGIAYLPLALVMLVRAIQVLMGSADPGPLVNEYMPLAIALMGVLSSVLGNTGFLGVYVERASRQQIQHAQELARREENARLGRQITRLDRQRAMGMISATLAHELRQPLAGIGLNAECAEQIIRQDHAPASATAPFIAAILHNMRNASDIMNRIQGFIQAKPVEHQRTSLQTVCTNVNHLMGDWLRSEHMALQMQLPPTPLNVQGDPVQLAQILVNLIRNSGQATAGQSSRRITLTLEQQGPHALLHVQDNGPGFDAGALQNNANAFYTTKTDGLGVGLSISRSIAEQHQGSLSLRNAPEGGAIVTLTLPLL
jgi:signal transduction histidine kinase